MMSASRPKISDASALTLHKILRISEHTFAKGKIAHPLRAWRKRRGLTQLETAAIFGVCVAHISQIESGRGEPSLELAVRFSQLTGTDTAEFSGWTRGVTA